MNKEDLIIKLCKTRGYKNYYDLGAFPNKDTINLYNRLIKNNVNIYAFEPHVGSYELLVKNFGKKINSFPIAAGAKNKKLILYIK